MSEGLAKAVVQRYCHVKAKAGLQVPSFPSLLCIRVSLKCLLQLPPSPHLDPFFSPTFLPSLSPITVAVNHCTDCITALS